MPDLNLHMDSFLKRTYLSNCLYSPTLQKTNKETTKKTFPLFTVVCFLFSQNVKMSGVAMKGKVCYVGVSVKKVIGGQILKWFTVLNVQKIAGEPNWVISWQVIKIFPNYWFTLTRFLSASISKNEEKKKKKKEGGNWIDDELCPILAISNIHLCIHEWLEKGHIFLINRRISPSNYLLCLVIKI